MSRHEHTPGPWKVVKPGHGHETDLRCVQIGPDESDTTLELKPADARLIARAPDLLEAAELALARLDALALSAPGDEYERTLEVASKLEAVIRDCEPGLPGGTGRGC